MSQNQNVQKDGKSINVNVTVDGAQGRSIVDTILAFKAVLTIIIMVAAIVAVAIIVAHLTRARERVRARANLIERQVVITETIVTGFRGAANLITLNVDLEHQVYIAEQGFLRIGTREQSVTFHGNGLFTTDLSVFMDDNVIIDTFRERIWVSVQRPIFYGVIIDAENTVVGDTITSFFAWGQITRSMEELNELLYHAQYEMEARAIRELMDYAYAYTEKTVRDLLTTILSAANIDTEGYAVEIKWQ